MPSLREMARAVGELVDLETKRIRELEQMTYCRGFEPGPDLAFAGIRVALMEGQAARDLLGQLAPHEPALRAWLADRQAQARGEATPTTASSH